MTDFWTAVGAVAAVIALMVIAYQAGSSAGYGRAKGELNNDREAKRFREIYAPIVGLFLTRHVTTASGFSAPYLKQRLRHAFESLKEFHWKKAFRDLFDRQASGPSGEVEYGGSFPLPQITKILQGREQFADQELILLVSRANRAQYEDEPGPSELTETDLRLLDHIWSEHESLSKRFIGT